VAFAQPGSEFVQLEMRNVQVAEGTLVQDLSMLASTSQPGGDGRLSIAEDPWSLGSVQSFGKCSEHHGNFMGWGFQSVQGCVTSSTKCSVTGLATKGLHLLSATMSSITNQSVHVGIGDSGVQTCAVRTGETFGVHPLRGASAALHLTPGAQTLAPHSTRVWR